MTALLRPGYRWQRGAPRRRQHGLATLVVVMLLLLVMALVAGYTNRNLFFEQRVSANQYRATQALEAAEAGLEWGLAMLSAGRIDATCQPVADPASAEPSFRQRYLQIDDVDGSIEALTTAAGAPLQPACVFDGAAWRCSCPTAGAPALAEPAGLDSHPAFRLEFEGAPGLPAGVVRLQAVGCTRLDAAQVCADEASSGDGRAVVTVLVALQSALRTPPVGAVTVPGVPAAPDFGVGLLRAVNADAVAGGVTLHTGVAPVGVAELHTVPGSPAAESAVEDATLVPLGADDLLFNHLFGMEVATYGDQPGTIVVDCDAGCGAAGVRDMVRLNPGRMVWIDGDLDLDIADPIGTPDAPALLVVDGTLTASDPAAAVTGMIYTFGDTSGVPGALTLRGALVAHTTLTLAGPGTTTVVYNRDVLQRLRLTHGSFVQVPGSWKDF